ncbi:tyrosine-protein phosphatase non-receptor type 22 [Diretmus argenteus]
MEQQAWILRSLLAELEQKEAVEEAAENGYSGEFLRLKRQSIKYRTDKTYPTKAAEKQDNVKKNRYKDIVPFDHSRVKLTLTTSKNDSDYINASFIKGMSGSRAYIATQGPLLHTVLDFWRMLWEYRVEVIVMCCREFEMGKRKCECYWPEKQEEPFVCEPFTVYCDSEKSNGDYLTRMLRVTYRNCSRTFYQLHYVNWPDHGVPDSIPPILEMLQEMRSYQAHDDVPICIHCSAGCGRTGALCVIDYTWNLVKNQMLRADFSIYNLVQNMRTQRPSVVQTKEQYELVYRTIKLVFERYLQAVEEQSSRNEVAVASNWSEELESDLPGPELQHLLDSQHRFPVTETQGQTPNHVAPLKMPSLAVEGVVLPQCQATLSCPSDILVALRTRDNHREQLRQHLPPTQEVQEGPCFSGFTRTSPTLGHTSHRDPGLQESIEEGDEIPSLKLAVPPPVATICLTVEDPYFDLPLSVPEEAEEAEEAPMGSTEDVAATSQWTANPLFSTPSLTLNDKPLEVNSPASGTVGTEDIPPPLPVRTAESYVLAADAESSEPCERLVVVIPPNAAAVAIREIGGCPPSPVPSLPERTPESFELAIDQAPVEQKLEVTPAVNLSRIGVSSEWSGNSIQANGATQNEIKPWRRSKSLKVKMTFTAPALTHPVLASNTTPYLAPPPPPPPALTPPSTQAEESPTPPIPDRTPESFILATEEVQENTAPCLQSCHTTELSPRIGVSLEWAGTSQPKTFLDVVMNRSKSVRAKGSRHE